MLKLIKNSIFLSIILGPNVPLLAGDGPDYRSLLDRMAQSETRIGKLETPEKSWIDKIGDHFARGTKIQHEHAGITEAVKALPEVAKNLPTKVTVNHTFPKDNIKHHVSLSFPSKNTIFASLGFVGALGSMALIAHGILDAFKTIKAKSELNPNQPKTQIPGYKAYVPAIAQILTGLVTGASSIYTIYQFGK